MKKYIVIGLVTFVIIGFIMPSQAKAQSLEGIKLLAIPKIEKPIKDMTIPELQAKIQEIMTLIQQLQMLLSQTKGETPTDLSKIPSTYSFPSFLELKYDQCSGHVKYLQIFLNSFPDTKLSDTGPGSPGQETMCFGPKTKLAVIKFQEEYKQDILTPLGLTEGTGFVGSQTISKINEILAEYRKKPAPLTTGPLTSGLITTGPQCGNNTDKICPSGCDHTRDKDCTYCGDSIIQTPNDQGTHEVCDKANLKAQTCIGLGYVSGTLSCSSNCITYNVANCVRASGSGGGGGASVQPVTQNRAPVLNSIGNKSINENSTITFTVSATDPDGNTLYYSVSNRPTGATFSTRTFTWTPSYTQQGTYNVTFTVSDGSLSKSETITITVNDVCQPTTCQAQGKNCGTISDNCGGTLNCGTCSTGYSCSSGTCVLTPTTPVTSCTTDSDCSSRGPGFICNTSKTCEWKPPIGIPKPTFGIEETYRMYNTPANRNPSLTYTQNTEGGFYTHYVDNTHPNATDTSNPYGTASKPRKSIPWNLPPGSVVEIYSEPSNRGPSGEVLISGEGTKEMPIFIRGVGNPRIGRQVDIGYYGNARYIIVEGINSFSGGVHARIEGISFTVSHIAFRNCDFHGDENGGAFGISSWTSNKVEHIVLYNSLIHDNGIWDRGDDVDRDIGGIKVGSKVSYLWVVDNEMYRNECNGIQLSGGPVTHHIYVGRNIAHHNRQSGFWTKSAEDVIFSENTAYGHKPAPFSDPFGAGLGFQYDPDRVWFLFNRIYNNTSGIRCGSSRLGGGRKEIHYIGNIIYDIQGMALGIYDHGDDGDAYFVGNTMYNVGTGITDSSGADDTATIVNNIFGTLSDPGGLHISLGGAEYRNNAIVSNNLFQEPMKVNTGCNNCIQANPLFVDAANGNFRLQPTSPAIDAGIESQVYQRFYELYGIDIRKDIEGRTKPQDGDNNGAAEWDMGAYEYPSGTGTCSGIDTSCGTWPSCQNCNNLDVCSGNSYRNYYCSGTSCIYTEDNCSDCSCSCGGYNVTESIANNNCSDGRDNDCDGQTDSQDTGCQECTSGQTSSCTTGLRGICSSGTKTCQANGTWGSCVQNNSPTAEICTDSLDNDCDGTTDCADTDCSADSICATAIPSDYISFWKFEGNAYDEKGINNGTLFGNTTFINDPNKGNVVSFDGAGDYVDFGDINLMDNLSAITISAWVKYNRVAGAGAIVSKWNSQSVGRSNWKINYGIDTNIDYYYYSVSLYDSVGGAHTVSTGWKTGSNTNWHHVVGVYNGSYVLLYVDSIQVGTPSAMTGNTGSSDVKVSIGSQYAGDPATPVYFVNGSIDEVMIFNRALSTQEIQNIYNSQKPTGMGMIEETKLKGLASLLDAIKDILEEAKELVLEVFLEAEQRR